MSLKVDFFKQKKIASLVAIVLLTPALSSSQHCLASEGEKISESENKQKKEKKGKMENLKMKTKYSTPFIEPSSLNEKNEKFEQARNLFSKAFNFHKDNKYLEAADNYDYAIGQYPNFFEAYFNLGLCLRHLNKPAKAIQCFEKASKLNSLYKPCFKELYELYEEQGRTTEAQSARAQYSLL